MHTGHFFANSNHHTPPRELRRSHTQGRAQVCSSGLTRPNTKDAAALWAGGAAAPACSAQLARHPPRRRHTRAQPARSPAHTAAAVVAALGGRHGRQSRLNAAHVHGWPACFSRLQAFRLYVQDAGLSRQPAAGTCAMRGCQQQVRQQLPAACTCSTSPAVLQARQQPDKNSNARPASQRRPLPPAATHPHVAPAQPASQPASRPHHSLPVSRARACHTPRMHCARLVRCCSCCCYAACASRRRLLLRRTGWRRRAGC